MKVIKKWGSIKLILLISFILFGVPFIINYLGNYITFKTRANFGDWLSFWGSYLGGIITLVGVWLAFYLNRKQEIENKMLERNEASTFAKLWCISVMKRDCETLTEEDVVKMMVNYDKFFLDIKTVSKEFHELTLSIGIIMIELHASIQSNDNDGIKEDTLALQEKVKELHFLITKTEGSTIYSEMAKSNNQK